MKNLPYAEDIGHFWKTSKTPADSWMEKTIALIKAHGGKPLQAFTGQDMETGRSAFMLSFKFGDDTFKISFPVLPSRAHDEKSAKIQAATLLHHCVKAKLLEAEILGTRTAFFAFLALPDGRTTAEVAIPELLQIFPSPVQHRPQLTSGEDVIDGEYVTKA
jgi:hypothetical protein